MDTLVLVIILKKIKVDYVFEVTPYMKDRPM